MGWLIEDRDKYDDAWHIELPVESKLLIDYLHCSCNRAGFLKWSATIASNKTGIAKDRIDGFLKILTGEVDINDYKIYCRKGIIYLHDHISIQQPNGLDVTNTAHIGILKFLFTQIDLFPECLVYFPDDHVAMKKTIENYIKHGGAKNKASAMKSLLRELNRVEPRKIIVSAADQKEFDLLPKETPSIIKECLRMLSAVPGYPFDYDIDRKILIDFLNDYGDKGFLYCLKSKVINWIDKPSKIK